MAEQQRKRKGPAPTGKTPKMDIRLSAQQRAVAIQIARNAGKQATVAAGVKLLLAQAASQLANT